MTHHTHRFSRYRMAFFCLLMVLFLTMLGCSSGEQQVVDRPGEEQQQVVDRPDDQQQVDRPNEGGQEQPADQPGQSQGEQQVVVGPDGEGQASSDLTEDILFSALIRINPIFEIQVGNDECVIALIPHNPDGESVCNDLDIVGMPYQDGVNAVMDMAYRRGFLESGDHLDIVMTFRESSEQTMFAYNIELHEVIDQYAQSHGIDNLQFSGGCGSQTFVENEDPQWTPENDSHSSAEPGHASNQEILETDANGNVLHYIEHHDDHTREFFLDASGRELKTILTIFDGTVITTIHHPNGTIAEEIQTTPDGHHHTSIYDTNGMIISSQEHTPDGYHNQITYHPNGNLATEITDGPDGFHIERTYSEDGLSMSSTDSDGRVTTETYYEDGTLAIRKADYGESVVEDHYDQSGNLTLSIATNRNGHRTETHWNPDRSGSMTQYGTDGSSSTVYFRPDGKVTHGYDSNGNYYEETGDVYAGTKNGGKG